MLLASRAIARLFILGGVSRRDSRPRSRGSSRRESPPGLANMAPFNAISMITMGSAPPCKIGSSWDKRWRACPPWNTSEGWRLSERTQLKKKGRRSRRPFSFSDANVRLDDVDNLTRTSVHEHDIVAPHEIFDRATTCHHDDIWWSVIKNDCAR